MAQLSARKARMMLHEGMIKGHKITPKQRGFLGARASGYPMRKSMHETIITAFSNISRQAPPVSWSGGEKFGNEV